MIYYEGLESIIECIYLSENINNKTSLCDIYVNPENIKFLTGKIIIINSCEYPEDNIKQLIDNGCHVISRVYFDIPEIEIQPYILKLNFNVMWNGKLIDKFSNLDELFEDEDCRFSIDDYKLYFPQINTNNINTKLLDSYGNLTSLGWVLQQVGVNVKIDTPFSNLDVLKTGKVIFE